MTTSCSIRTIVFVAMVVALTACGTSPPTNFYVLSPIAGSGGPRPSGDAEQIVGVGPVEVSAYLDRSQIVIREGANRIELADFHQWAEPVGDNIATVLAENLSTLLPQVHAIVRPWSDVPTDFQVPVKILRFDSDPAGRIHLRSSWSIVDRGDHRYRVLRESVIVKQASGSGFEDIAAGMSGALQELSEEIATELSKLLKGNGKRTERLSP